MGSSAGTPDEGLGACACWGLRGPRELPWPRDDRRLGPRLEWVRLVVFEFKLDSG
jgi:hypothetical protein